MLKYILATIAIILLLALGDRRLANPIDVPSSSNTVVVADPVPKDLDSEFVNQLYNICGAKLSEMRGKLLTEQLLVVTNKYFSSTNDKQAFLYLICIESKFDLRAHSKAGAVGYTQVMPKYAQGFADACNLGKLEPADVSDPTTNLNLGACQFSVLLKQFSGNVALALAGYNSGANSETTKRLSNLGEGLPETSGYLAKYLVLEQKVRGAK